MKSDCYRSIYGTVIFDRSESSECVCCDGKHIYGRRIEIKPRRSKVFAGLNTESVSDFMWESMVLLPNIEGKRVKITIEIVGKRRVSK